MFNIGEYIKYKCIFLKEENVNDMYKLCELNKPYYNCFDEMPTIDGVKTILNEVPPGSSLNDKYVIGFYENEKLIAILDLVKGYPSSEYVFIGLLIIDVNYQGKGVGKYIMDSLFKMLKDLNFKKCQLGCLDNNESAKKFWIMNGFEVNGTVYNHEKYNVVMMERSVL